MSAIATNRTFKSLENFISFCLNNSNSMIVEIFDKNVSCRYLTQTKQEVTMIDSVDHIPAFPSTPPPTPPTLCTRTS